MPLYSGAHGVAGGVSGKETGGPVGFFGSPLLLAAGGDAPRRLALRMGRNVPPLTALVKPNPFEAAW